MAPRKKAVPSEEPTIEKPPEHAVTANVAPATPVPSLNVAPVRVGRPAAPRPSSSLRAPSKSNKGGGKGASGKGLSRGMSVSSVVLAVSVILYATGFVVVSTSLERLGVNMPIGDFLKVQYIYVGVICVSFVVFIFGISYLLFQFIEIRLFGAVAPRRDIPRPSVVAMSVFSVALYLQVAFAQPGTLSIYSALALNVFIGAWLFISLYSQRLASKPRIRDCLPYSLVIVALLYFSVECATIYGADWTKPAWSSKASMLITILPITQSLYLGRLIYRWIKQERYRELEFAERFQWYFLNGSVVALLYYATILSFALIFYTHMPIRKGGADFTKASAAVLHLKARRVLPTQDAVIDPLDDSGLMTIPVVILAENSFSYYVAGDPFNERNQWGKLGDARPPRIWEIPRDAVAGISLSDNWPRPNPADVNYVFGADTICSQRADEAPGQLTGLIRKGAKAAIIRSAPDRWLIWTEDGGIRAWVSVAPSPITGSK